MNQLVDVDAISGLVTVETRQPIERDDTRGNASEKNGGDSGGTRFCEIAN